MTLVYNDQRKVIADMDGEKDDISNNDIVKFMQAMQVSIDNISKDIKKSNSQLGKEIKDSKDELKGEIKNLKEKMDDEVKEVKKGTEKVREDLEKASNDARKRMERMETRLEKIEVENVNLDQQKRKRDAIANAKVPEIVVAQIQPVGSNYSEVLKKKAPEISVPEVQEYRSTWARQMSQISLENQLKMATEAADCLEGQEGNETEFQRKERSAHKTKKLKLGDSAELHDPADWPWETSEEDWDGTTDRQARNSEKKRREKEKKEKKLLKAVNVGKCTIGLGPIKEKSFDYFNKITADYSEAKKMAAAEFLTGYLRFDHNDMSDFDILDTRVSGKKDDILYVVLDSPSKVRDIRRCIADCENPDIKTRDYIPLIFFEKIFSPGQVCCRLEEQGPYNKDSNKIF